MQVREETAVEICEIQMTFRHIIYIMMIQNLRFLNLRIIHPRTKKVTKFTGSIIRYITGVLISIKEWKLKVK